jgi:hypothetical protein
MADGRQRRHLLNEPRKQWDNAAMEKTVVTRRSDI